MAISADDVKKIAKLARLALSPEEVALYGSQCSKILDSMAELSRLDTASVEPTASVLGLSNVLREDEARPFGDSEKLLANAPEREGNFFKVKKVIE